MSSQPPHAELDRAWTESYSPQRKARALEAIADKPIKIQVMHFAMRMFFSGIYFPQTTKRAWIKLIVDNRGSILRLVREAIGKWRAGEERSRQCRSRAWEHSTCGRFCPAP